MLELGYTTGTFDLLHEGHYELLKKCKSFCKTLIVGLVTDELGEKQKRKPVLKYSHRKILLENSKYVDFVVPFNGTTKQEDYIKLRFNVLFISDEYYLSEEYSSFETDVKNIPIYYFPRTETSSTSDIYQNILREVIENTKIYNSGTGSEIVSYRYKNNKGLVVKTINVAERELGNTKNNYDMNPNNLPRNWKLLNCPKGAYPNLSGVNPMREIEIFKFLKDKSWYPIHKIVTKDKNFNYKYYHKTQLNKNVNLINDERKFGRKSFWIIQEDCGKTFKEIYNKCDKAKIFEKIITIINEMRSMGILHMDLHSDNILIDSNDNVFIIDFGWCIHRSFELSQSERNTYENLLSSNFDLKHFAESLVTMELEKEIPKLFYRQV